MSKFFWKIIYQVLISPLIIISAHLAGIFSKAIREGLLPRYRVFKELRGWKPVKKTVMFHAASLGEFEHIKPLLRILHETYDTTNVVTFFSPSGYNHAQSGDAMTLRLYLPFDLFFLWYRFYRLIRPDLLIIAKHDVWPVQIWAANKQNIPVYLINASLAEKSSRTKWYIKSFLKHVYREITQICAISQEDMKRFSRHYPDCNVMLIGDTKYDQVVLRKKAAMKQNLLPGTWKNGKWIFVAGSVWPEDTQHLFPVLQILLKRYRQFQIIIVPHQPNEREVERIEAEFSQWKCCKYSDRANLKDQRILIVDSVGLLAALYNNARAAYVGGSFKQGVHNVMEPAIYGIPVIYGPVHTNSYEAVKLKQTGGGMIINNSSEFESQMEKFINDEAIRESSGNKAVNFAISNTGATDKLMELWRPIVGKANM